MFTTSESCLHGRYGIKQTNCNCIEHVWLVLWWSYLVLPAVTCTCVINSLQRVNPTTWIVASGSGLVPSGYEVKYISDHCHECESSQDPSTLCVQEECKGYATICIPVEDSATITQMGTSVNIFTECTHLTSHHNQQSLNLKTTLIYWHFWRWRPPCFFGVRDHSKGKLNKLFQQNHYTQHRCCLTAQHIWFTNSWIAAVTARVFTLHYPI